WRSDLARSTHARSRCLSRARHRNLSGCLGDRGQCSVNRPLAFPLAFTWSTQGSVAAHSWTSLVGGAAEDGARQRPPAGPCAGVAGALIRKRRNRQCSGSRGRPIVTTDEPGWIGLEAWVAVLRLAASLEP